MTGKRILACVLCLLFVVLGCKMPAFAEETQEDPAVVSGCHSPDGALTLFGDMDIGENARAILAYETGSDTLLYCRQADAQIYPASFVKLMTALLVLENGKLSDIVTVQQSALDSLDDSAISTDLAAGEVISVEDLLYCMLVASSNDAAAVLAEYIAGSQDSFVERMNERAQELGCTGTFYTNPHGLHDENQVSTARDTCKILREALCYNEFRVMFGTVFYTVPETNLHGERRLTTGNYLMSTESVGIHYDKRVTGGRTGMTTEGYRNVATVSEIGNMEIICVIMEAKSTLAENGSVSSFGGFPETSEILDVVADGYSRQQIIFEGEILKQKSVINGDCDVFAAAAQSFSAVLPEGTDISQLTFRYSDVPSSDQAPIQKGQNLASLQVWYGNLCMGQTDVYAMNHVSVATTKVVSDQNAEGSGSSFGKILMVVVILIAAVSAVLLFIRYRAIARHNRKKHRRRR